MRSRRHLMRWSHFPLLTVASTLKKEPTICFKLQTFDWEYAFSIMQNTGRHDARREYTGLLHSREPSDTYRARNKSLQIMSMQDPGRARQKR